MEFEYEKLLDKAYKEIPEEVKLTKRFEMPQVEVLLEGNKTILRNFAHLAKVMRRDEPHFQKFLVKELGSYTAVSGERLIFNKKLFGKKIGDAVKRYASEYVICAQCGRPDTRFSNLEGVKILKCEACGAWRPLKNI